MARRKKQADDRLVVPALVSDDEQMAFLKKVTDRMKDKKRTVGTIEDMLPDTVYLSICTSLNRTLGKGGLTSRRFYLVHGQNSTGKSVLALAIGETFRRYGFVVDVADSEFGAEREWYRALVKSLGMLFDMPEFLDDYFARTQDLFDSVREVRAKKKFAMNEGPGLCSIVDTLTQLSPKSALDKVRDEGVKRAYSEAAQWNGWYVKSFVPQAFHNNSVLVAVTQERENTDRKTQFDPKYRLTGGQALQFGSMVRFHVSSASAVKEGDRVVGQQTRYVVEKNKSDGTSKQRGSFFTSNGRGGVPAGFDFVREALEEAKYRKQIHARAKTAKLKAGNEIVVGDFSERFPGGQANMREALNADPELFKALTDALNTDAVRASYECAPSFKKKKK